MSKYASDENVRLGGGEQDSNPARRDGIGDQADPDLFIGMYMLTLSSYDVLSRAGAGLITSQVYAVNNAGPTYAKGLEYWSLSPDFIRGLAWARINHTTLTFAGTRNPGPVAPIGFPASDAYPFFTMPSAPPTSRWTAVAPAALPRAWFSSTTPSGVPMAVHFDCSVAPPAITWYQLVPPTRQPVTRLVSCGAATVFTYTLAQVSTTGWFKLDQPSSFPTPGMAWLSPYASPSMQSTSLAHSQGMLFQACVGRIGEAAALSILASNDGCAWASFPPFEESSVPSVGDRSAPSIASSAGGQHCIAYVDASGTAIMASAFSPAVNAWSPSTVATGRALSGPALAALDSTLFAAYQEREDGALHVCRATGFGSAWTAVATPGLTGAASGAPAMVALSNHTEDNLYLAVVMGADIALFSSSDGTTWTPIPSASLAPPSSDAWTGVALSAYNGVLYLAATSRSGLQVRSLGEGGRWSDSLTPAWAESTAGASNPAMSALDGSLLVVSYIHGTSPAARVNYAYLR